MSVESCSVELFCPCWAEFCPLFSVSLLSHLFHSENLATAFILLNRFTAISMPFRHEQIWAWLLPVSVGVILFAPLPFTWIIFARNYYIHYSTDQNTTFTEDIRLSGNDTDHWDDSDYTAISSVAFCVVCLALNVASIIAYQRRSSVVVLATPAVSTVGGQTVIHQCLRDLSISQTVHTASRKICPSQSR